MATIESRIIKALRGQKKKAVTPKDLAKKMGLRRADREAFFEAVEALKAGGQLVEKNGALSLAESLGLVPGEIVKVNGTFGFARPAGAERDVFIPGKLLAGALPGDQVLLKVTRGAGELHEGEVFSITKAANRVFSAVLEMQQDGFATVLPDRYLRYSLPVSGGLMGARDGDKVLAVITDRGSRHSEHRAKILEVFGSANSAAACARAVLAANGVRAAFPDEALAEARAVAEAGIHPKEIEARLDLRDDLIFTIDGADSKDMDDAISLRKRADGWELGVHIADVSYYVKQNSPLDEEAFERGTSVYYADSVVPMLPTELSNGICSLNPGEDRLAFSALLELDGGGKLTGSRFVKTVIRSRVKGVYGEVNAVFDGSADFKTLAKYMGLTDALSAMKSLAATLTENRKRRGSVDLDSVESRILLDGNGVAVGVEPRTTGTAERMIEEFMLTANEAAASLALEKELPFLFRVHENPAPDKTAALFDVLEELGVKVKRPKDIITAKELAAVVDAVRGTPAAPVINAMALRSMAKAKYSAEHAGHFGLALANYAHFTSPIRRYPDLAIHRILSALVTGMKLDNIKKRYASFAGEAARQSSAREIAAMTAERACVGCYCAEYMRGRLGEELTGVISSVTAFGAYVTLPDTVEGLIHVRNLAGDSWQLSGALALVDAVTGRRLAVGEEIRVRVISANVSAGTIDFSPAGMTPSSYDTGASAPRT